MSDSAEQRRQEAEDLMAMHQNASDISDDQEEISEEQSKLHFFQVLLQSAILNFEV